MSRDVHPIPETTIEWTAQRGDARRATLSSLKSTKVWLGVTAIALVTAAVVTVVQAKGDYWVAALTMFGILLIGYTALAIGIMLAVVHLTNRRVLAAGAQWASGINDHAIRIDTPAVTMLISRSGLRSIRRTGTLTVLRTPAAGSIAVPSILLPDTDLITGSAANAS
ncbi:MULTISPECIES: hypothetical protein [Mycobacteriaceae]|uniref:hypothetical protein n=1 Tax=Mycobacteriaceae TaxID=1762 RepID=UPI001300FAD8|nr:MULTISPECIES: hypothetical protein [Mycobacteriaceae]